MVRLTAIFIAFCMVLIAGSVGLVLYLRAGLTAVEAGLVALAVLTALAVYNAVSGRARDRTVVSNQIANLARGSGDLARQLAEFGRRLTAMETKVGTVLDRALATAQPLAIEIEELSRLVKQLADTVAEHDAALGVQRAAGAPLTVVDPLPPTPSEPTVGRPEEPPVPVPSAARPVVAAFSGLDKDAIIALIRDAIEAHRIDLYLQPIVTLPQRKVRYYEAVSRLKAGNGDVVAAGDFLDYAEAGSLLPKLDNLSVLRCVQMVRRLLLKNREIGLFCNLSGTTLSDGSFSQLLEFVEANRAIAPSMMFEFTQSGVRAMGPIEHESLAALAERGFRFSMDNLTDLRVEPRELADRGFRFIKAPAGMLLNRAGAASADIHPADFSDLLGRFGIDLIAERIENESTVVDLLDCDVRFAQGFLFSPPRPVRAEALQGVAADAFKSDAVKIETAGSDSTAQPVAAGNAAPATSSGLAQLARAGTGRS